MCKHPWIFFFILILGCEAKSHLNRNSTPLDAPIEPGWMTFVVLPDTQYYSESYPEIYLDQTEWIRKAKILRNIMAVAHVGDITNTNTTIEWQRARAAMDNLEPDIPYVMIPGNHDYGPRGDASSRDTLMHDHFKAGDALSLPYFGSSYPEGKLDNYFRLVPTPKGEWLLLGLGFAPNDGAMAWANGVINLHPNANVMLITHAYLYSDDTRYDHVMHPEQMWNPHSYPLAEQERVHDGEEIYQDLVKKHPNVKLVVSGHVLNDGSGLNLDGGTIQMLANFQFEDMGGGGYLRVLELSDHELRVRTYSPHLKHERTEASQSFNLPFVPVSH